MFHYIEEIFMQLVDYIAMETSPTTPSRSVVNDEFALRPYMMFKHDFGEGDVVPRERSGHRIVTDGINVYSFGGFALTRASDNIHDAILQEDCNLFKELWKYNLVSNTWTKLETSEDMPTELASATVMLCDNNIIVYGGTGIPFGHRSSNILWLCNLNTLRWQQMPLNGTYPLPLYGQSMIKHQSKIYVIGGTTGFQYFMDVHCFDLETMTWTELITDDSPEGRYRHEVVLHDEKLFVFGGGRPPEMFPLIEIPVFDLNQKTWSTLATTYDENDVPTARYCHSCVKVEDDVIITGGFDGSSAFSDIWKFNLKTFCWTRLLCQLPQDLYFHSATVTEEGQMFVFGGVNCVKRNTRTNDLLSVWVKIPTLSEMCWQAALQYWPGLVHKDKTTLHTTGIPVKFWQRLGLR